MQEVRNALNTGMVGGRGGMGGMNRMGGGGGGMGRPGPYDRQERFGGGMGMGGNMGFRGRGRGNVKGEFDDCYMKNGKLCTNA